ncbi:MAG: FN3 associated domain-containing protein [Planctomycetota bacterium]
MLEVETRDGEVLEIPGFDLQTEHAAWQFQPHCYFQFIEADEHHPAHWAMLDELPGHDGLGRGLWTETNIALKPNRRYLISALIRSRFDRMQMEINIGFEPLDKMENRLIGRPQLGVPSPTRGPNGWERWETVVKTLPQAELVMGRPRFDIWINAEAEKPYDFCIADLKIAELPASPIEPIAEPIRKVTFPGGPGALPMAVEAPEQIDDGYVVATTGVRWAINPEARTITAHQRIDFPRPLATWTFGVPLDGLEVLRANDTVVVLQNKHIALGVQCDGMLAVYPRSETSVTVESHLATPFVRYGDGHLLATDGLGGFGTNPYPPPGSGKLADSTPVTLDLDFAGFDGGDLELLSKEPAGWQVCWNLEAGERLFLAALPPRPFDWQQSFSLVYQLTMPDWTQADYFSDYSEPAETFLLWLFHARAWGTHFGTRYLPLDADTIREHIGWAHGQGKRAIFYSSAWFFGSRNPDDYVGAVKGHIDEFGFDGFYSDGLPAIEWLVGYEQMRRLRQDLHDKLIVVHDSLPQSGRHPAVLTPCLYTYADATYMAEHVATQAGPGWAWVRYVIGQHRLANTTGTIKGDAWDGPPFNKHMDKFLAGLIWNARRAELRGDGIHEHYPPVKHQLHELWKRHGDDPHYYDRYHVEAARQFSGFRVGPAAMPIFTTPNNSSVEPTSQTPGATIRYTLDRSVPTAKSALYKEPLTLTGDQRLRAVAEASGLETSPPTPAYGAD